MNSVLENIKDSYKRITELDKKVISIFFIVAFLNIISYYLTSRKFFRQEIITLFEYNEYVPLYEFLYWFIGDFFTFFILTFIIIKFYHKENITDYGFTFGNYKLGFKVYFLFMLIFIPIIWVVSSFESFSSLYPHLALAKKDLSIFLIYELGMLFYMFGWEFIWRGYTLFGLEKKFGWYAIFIQMIPFVILHNGKPPIETIGSIFAAIALGALAFKTRSFIYCVLIHFSVMLIIDLFGYIRFQTQYFKILF